MKSNFKVYPLEPQFYVVKLRFTEVYLFLIFDPKHRLWVLIRTALERQFLRVPTINILSKNKNVKIFIDIVNVYS